MIILFQTATSAGWDGVLSGLLISPPDCNDTFVSESMPHGDCGSGGLAIAYLVTYGTCLSTYVSLSTWSPTW